MSTVCLHRMNTRIISLWVFREIVTGNLAKTIVQEPLVRVQPHETTDVDRPRAQVGVARLNEFCHVFAHAAGQSNTIAIGSRSDEIIIDLEIISRSTCERQVQGEPRQIRS